MLRTLNIRAELVETVLKQEMIQLGFYFMIKHVDPSPLRSILIKFEFILSANFFLKDSLFPLIFLLEEN